MKKVDEAVRRETLYIFFFVLAQSAVMEAVFFFLGKWDATVLFGNLLSAAAVVLNFFLMGLTIQNALKKEEKDAKNLMKLSQTYRFLFLALVIGLGVWLPAFHPWSVIIPVFFPRIAIFFRPLFDRK